jgi:Skp family chaperone for outer membrane proteins
MLTSLVRLTALLSVLCCGFAEIAIAQKPPATPPAPPPAPAPVPLPAAQNLSVLVVDVQSLLQNAKAAKMVRNQIEQKRVQYMNELSHQQDLLRAEQGAQQKQRASLSAEHDTLERQRPSLSADVFDQKRRQFEQKANAFLQKERDLDEKIKNYQENGQELTQTLAKSASDAQSKINEIIVKITEDIAKQRKANLVFQSTDFVAFDRSFDVTDEVLQKLDEELPVLNVNFVTPAPPSTGAAPVAASPPAATAPTAKAKRR